MPQELGETVQEMIKADNDEVENIINRRPTGHYWIVIAHRRTKMHMDTGEQVIMRLVKAYDKKPGKQLGTIVLEIKDGDLISCDVSPHDAPINWGMIEKHAGLIDHPGVKKDPLVAQSYIYNE